MELKIFQVEALADSPFQGNPAEFCTIDAWLDDERLEAIAEEKNLSETAFVVCRDGDSRLRWYTQQVEVELCG
ncbi:PhzF family phenazine biosynthesis protein, partial [Pseudomonas aeruginosa]